MIWVSRDQFSESDSTVYHHLHWHEFHYQLIDRNKTKILEKYTTNIQQTFRIADRGVIDTARERHKKFQHQYFANV